jgi:hypothetical protein
MAIDVDTLQLGPWTGGVWYSRAVEDVEPSALSEMGNMRIGGSGQLLTRPGTASYQGASALSGTPTLTSIGSFRKNASTKYTFLTAGTTLQYYNSGWSNITGSTTITAGNDNTFEWANCNGTLVLTNGVDTDAIKWTGTGNASALDDNARFTKAAHTAWFDNRLWMGNVNGATGQLWYSDIADIETWGATSFYNFGFEITAVTPTQNALVVHTVGGIFTLIPTGNNVLPYHRQQRTTEGAIGGRAVVSLPDDTQLFILNDGIYKWSGGANVEKISYQLDDGWWPNVETSRLEQAHALYYPDMNEVWFFLPYGASQQKPNKLMIYNTRFNCWVGPWDGWDRNCSALINDLPHAGDYGGFLYDHASGTSDSGTAIPWFFETGAPAPYGSDVRCRWRYARTYLDGVGDWTVAIVQESSGLIGTTNNLSLRSNSFILGTSVLGSDSLGGVRMIARDTNLSGYDPQSSLKYSNAGLDQPGTFRRLHLQYTPLGRKRRKTRV